MYTYMSTVVVSFSKPQATSSIHFEIRSCFGRPRRRKFAQESLTTRPASFLDAANLRSKQSAVGRIKEMYEVRSKNDESCDHVEARTRRFGRAVFRSECVRASQHEEADSKSAGRTDHRSMFQAGSQMVCWKSAPSRFDSPRPLVSSPLESAHPKCLVTL
jgi:hypothetical protein